MASSKCSLILCIALLLILAKADATQFRVGWTVPTDTNAISYNQWAQKRRFQIGDSLLFVYPPGKDSVLQVNLFAYSICNSSSYIQRFDDGNTVFPLTQSGPYYFISGDANNCLKGEAMAVVVMADRSNLNPSNHSRPSVPPASPPSPPPTAPAEVSPSSPPAPVASSPPLSPPTVLLPPTTPAEVPASPPPPPITAEVSPVSAPSGESSPPPPPSPKNGAALKVVGFMSSVGALFGSILVLL